MIPPIKKILYTTDLTKNSIYAFYYAVDLAQRRQGEIVILHAIEPLGSAAYGSGTDKRYQEQQENSIAVIKSRLQRFCVRVDEQDHLSCLSVVSKILVTLGDPGQEILKALEQEGCDLVVLGNHGRGFLAQALLGSTSRYVMDRTRKPVLYIPLPAEDETAWDEI